MLEIWKDNNNYGFKIMVSNMGKVKRAGGVLARLADNGHGYLSTNVKCPSKRIMKSGRARWIKKYVHILVHETFFPHADKSKDVHHMNGIRSDNRLCNLQRLSRGDNLEEAFIRRNENKYHISNAIMEEENLHL